MEIKQKNKGGNPNWKKGVSGNPNGRPTVAEIDKLRQAIEFGEQKFGKDIFRHAVERAFRNDIVLIALLKKILPDKLSGEGFDTRIIINNIKQILEDANRNAGTNRLSTSITSPGQLEK